MKKNIRFLLYTLVCGLILTLCISLVLSLFYFFNLFISYLSIISKVLGYVVFIICGYLLGRNIQERTFFYAFAFSCIGFLLSLIVIEKNVISILFLLSKWLLFILIAMLARNIKNRN